MIFSMGRLMEQLDSLPENGLPSCVNHWEGNRTALEDFVLLASHDLQAPIRKILIFASHLQGMLMERSSSAEEIECLRRIQKSALSMQSLVTDLLDLSQSQTKNRFFQQVALTQIAQHTIESLQEEILDSGGQITCSPLPSIDANPLQIQKLLRNLLENALKFHQAGCPPVIRIEASITEGICEIRIVDNGIGFDLQYQDKIFGSFERVCPKQYEGSGMGLALCKKIVERHHGSIHAESSPGQGACFTIRLPVQQQPEIPTVVYS